MLLKYKTGSCRVLSPTTFERSMGYKYIDADLGIFIRITHLIILNSTCEYDMELKNRPYMGQGNTRKTRFICHRILL